MNKINRHTKNFKKLIRSLKPFFIGCILLLLSSNLFAQLDYYGCYEENNSFHVNEKISYEGAYNLGFIWLTAGMATFELKDTTMLDQQAIHIIGSGKTYKNYDKFFRVRDRYESFINTEDHLPLRFIRQVSEGDFKLHNQYTFYSDSNYVNADFIKRQGKLKRKNAQFFLPDCTHDVLSAVYFVRSLDFDTMNENEFVSFKIMLDRKIYDVGITYHGKEVKKVRKGEKFMCHKVSFKLIAGTVFEDGQTMYIWATADKNNLPVAIESPLVVGKAKFYLTDFENLRYPMEAKL